MVAGRIVLAAHDACGSSRATARPEATIGILIVYVYMLLDRVRRCMRSNGGCAGCEVVL